MTRHTTLRTLQPADAAAFQALRLQALRECPSAFASSAQEEARDPHGAGALIRLPRMPLAMVPLQDDGRAHQPGPSPDRLNTVAVESLP
ncbi:MAG: hypothetical protein AB1430_10430 [Pseudomonadota bacterium]